MKQLTLFAIAFLLATVTNAQFTKGEKYLSGSFSGHLNDYDMSDNDGVESYSIFFAPSFHKFKTDKKATGFKLHLGFNQNETTGPGNVARYRFGTVGAGIFFQHYINLNKGVYLVAERGVNGFLSMGTNDIIAPPGGSADITNYGVNIYLTPGFGYRLNDRLVLGLNLSNLLSLNYTHSVTKQPTGKTKNDALNLFSSLNNTNLGNVAINFGWRLK